MLKKKLLRNIFGAKTDEITGEWRKLHNAELHAVGSSRRMRWLGYVARMARSTAVGQVVAYVPVTQRARVFDPCSGQVSWLRFFRGSSLPVTQMLGSVRPPRSPYIFWQSSSIIIHYGRQ